MTPLATSRNLSARMARWSAAHRKLAIFGWLGFVVLALVIGNLVGTQQLRDEDTVPGESGRAITIITPRQRRGRRRSSTAGTSARPPRRP